MKNIGFSLFLFFNFTIALYGQSDFGIEFGIHLTNYALQESTITTIATHFNGRALGGQAGFFYEKALSKTFHLKANIFYNFRYFQRGKTLDHTYAKVHTITAPLKLLLKIGKFHIGLGPDLIFLWGANAPNNNIPVRLGISGEVAYQVHQQTKIILYYNYDFFTVDFIHEPDQNNVLIGLGMSFRIKKFKKRWVIYSPGL